MMRMIMKSVMAGAFVSLATVAVPGAANAVVCGQPTAATLAQVIALGSCTVGDKTFSGFSYGQDGFTGLIQGIPNVPTTAVGVAPASTPDFGLAFNAGWTNANTAGIAADAAITFTVAITPPPGTTLITDAEVQVLSGFPVPGGFQDVMTFPGTTIAGLTTSDLLNHIRTITPGVLTLTVTDDLTVFPGGSVSVLDKQFSQTTGPIPEPASLAILGISLLGMGAAYRRHRK